MKFFGSLLLVLTRLLIPVLGVQLVFAQQQPAQQPPAHEWTPRGIETLRHSASSKTEFTIDHSMLVFASKLDPGNEDLRRVIAGVSGISVHSYRFAGRWAYDPQLLNSVKDEYHTAGWMQLVNDHDKDGEPGVTDVWIRLENNAISNVAVLVAKASDVDFFVVSGSISPMDLAHLGGHFGIPKIQGGVTVPNSTRRP